MNSLICKCGAVMVSDGTNWVCPFNGELGHSGDVEPDKRINLGRSVQVLRPLNPPGGGHSRVKKPKLHKGSLRSCFGCNPAGAANWRQHVSRLQAKGWRISL